MGRKLSGKRDLLDAVADFLKSTEKAACRNNEEVKAATRNTGIDGKTWRMVDGVVFNIDSQLRSSSSHIVQTIAKTLGSRLSDEENILTSLWNSATRRLIDNSPTVDIAARDFLKYIEQQANVERRYIHGNYLIGREPGVDKLSVGPVDIVDGALLAKELNANQGPNRWLIEVRDPGFESRDDGTLSVGVPQNCWSIAIKAARENLPEEAAWLAGTATSLLLLTARPSLGPFVGREGDLEPHPFKVPHIHHDGIATEQDSVSAGGMRWFRRYTVSADTVAYCSCSEFLTISEHIFAPAKASLAERISQGLGWLARGRQNEDRAERFLFFFTALEALLSDDDKTAPVVQTIARHAASILTDDHEGRAKNAKIVRDLYAARSSLVHRGARSVSKSDANTVERVAEILFQRVLDQCALDQEFRQFLNHLAHCSYGAAWGNDDIHRLGQTPDCPARPAPRST